MSGSGSVHRSIEILHELHGKQGLTTQEQNKLFEACLVVAKFTISRHRCDLSGQELEEFHMYLAEELYFLVLSGNIKYWSTSIHYLFIDSFNTFCKLFTSKNQDPRIEPLFDPTYYERYTKCGDLQVVVRNDVSIKLLELFLGARNWINRYRGWSCKKARLNARMSFILSVKYGHYINFRLSSLDSDICRFVYNRFKKSVIDEIRTSASVEELSVDAVAMISWFQHNVNPETEEY